MRLLYGKDKPRIPQTMEEQERIGAARSGGVFWSRHLKSCLRLTSPWADSMPGIGMAAGDCRNCFTTAHAWRQEIAGLRSSKVHAAWWCMQAGGACACWCSTSARTT